VATDTPIQEAKNLLDAIHAAHVAERAAFQAQVDALSTTNVALTAERDALLVEKASTVVELRSILNTLAAQVAALGP
jgi:hypothetical protein